VIKRKPEELWLQIPFGSCSVEKFRYTLTNSLVQDIPGTAERASISSRKQFLYYESLGGAFIVTSYISMLVSTLQCTFPSFTLAGEEFRYLGYLFSVLIRIYCASFSPIYLLTGYVYWLADHCVLWGFRWEDVCEGWLGTFRTQSKRPKSLHHDVRVFDSNGKKKVFQKMSRPCLKDFRNASEFHRSLFLRHWTWVIWEEAWRVNHLEWIPLLGGWRSTPSSHLDVVRLEEDFQRH